MRYFLFIDESGDPGIFDKPESSKFYYLHLLMIKSDQLPKVTEHFSRFRYFTNSGKELKKYMRPKQNHISILADLLGEIQNSSIVTSYFLEKKKYTGPYLKKIGHDKYDYDPRLFRNYVIRISLEHFFKSNPDFDGEIEIIIDRFLDSHTQEENLKLYIRKNYKIPDILHINQADSRCVEGLQIVDIVGTVIKDHVEKGYDNSIVGAKIFCIENPDSIKEKRPDTQ